MKMRDLTFLVFLSVVTFVAYTTASKTSRESDGSIQGAKVKRAATTEPKCSGSSIVIKDDFYYKDPDGIESKMLCPAGFAGGAQVERAVTESTYQMRSFGPKAFAVFTGTSTNGTAIHGFKFRISSTICDCGQYIRPKKFAQSCGYTGPGVVTAVETGGNCTHFWKSPPGSFLRLKFDNLNSKTTAKGCDGTRIKSSLDNQMKTADSYCGDTLPSYFGIKKALINSQSFNGDMRISGVSINANGADTYDENFQSECLCGLMTLPDMAVIPSAKKKRESGAEPSGRAVPGTTETCYLASLEVYNPSYQKTKTCFGNIIGRKAVLTTASCVGPQEVVTILTINGVDYPVGTTETDGRVTVVHLSTQLTLRRPDDLTAPICSLCLPCSNNTTPTMLMSGMTVESVPNTGLSGFLGQISGCTGCEYLDAGKFCLTKSNEQKIPTGMPFVTKIQRKGYMDHYVLTGISSDETCDGQFTPQFSQLFVSVIDSIPFIMDEVIKYGNACVPKVIAKAKRSVAEEFLDEIGV